jgi:glycosyltransferase involved in cell wall biosynthesis
MDRCKILFVITSFDGGGAERVFLHLLRNISRNKFDIHLAVGIKEGKFIDDIPKDIKLYELSKSHSSRKAIQPLYILIKEIEPNVVFSTLGMVVTSTIVSFFTSNKIKYIHRFGNTMSSYLEHVKKSSKLKYMIQYYLNKLVCLCGHIVVQSNYMKEDLIKTLNVKDDNITMIYNPIDFELYEQKYIDNTNVLHTSPNILSIGRLSWQKGYDYLLKAYKIVLASYPNSSLTIVGEGELKSELIELSIYLGIDSNVNFAGFNDDPFNVIKADLFVSSSRYEGFSNAILEALAHELPVVATDCPSGNKELIVEKQNGWLSSMENDIVDDLAKKIIYALENINKLDMQSEKDKIVEKFNIQKIINEYEKLFLTI